MRASSLPSTTLNAPGTSWRSTTPRVAHQVRHLGLVRRIDTAHQRPSCPRRASRAWQTNGAAPPPRLRRAAPAGEVQIGMAAPPGADFDARDHAEHAVTHLFLKTVHHRQHDDERRHPSAMPSMDTPEMNEMKPLRRVARPARV